MDEQIQEEIERLREQFDNTRDLYREVCTLLFFRYGITPTTNKLYQLVRKGSMSVPTEVLSSFWKDLREKSKIRIDQPDLPEDLGNMAGELMSKIWDKAQLEARESLSVLRDEIEAKVTELKTERDEIARNREDIVLKLQTAEQMLSNQANELKEVNRLLADSKMYEVSLEKQLQDNAVQLEELRRTMNTKVQTLNASIKEVTVQKQHELSLAMQEINKEQAHAVDLENKLAIEQASRDKLQDQHSSETNALKTELADLREKLGELNGKLELTQASNVQLSTEMAAKDERLKEILNKFTSTETQAKNWSDRIQQKKAKRFVPAR